MSATQTYFHTSPTAITEVRTDGLFGSFLFFSLEAGEHEAGGNDQIIYKTEISDGEIIEAGSMFFEHDSTQECLRSIIEEASDLLGVSTDEAADYLDESKSEWDIDGMDGDTSWARQLLTARAALALGYRGVEIEDEHGTSYMIDMSKQDMQRM